MTNVIKINNLIPISFVKLSIQYSNEQNSKNFKRNQLAKFILENWQKE